MGRNCLLLFTPLDIHYLTEAAKASAPFISPIISLWFHEVYNSCFSFKRSKKSEMIIFTAGGLLAGNRNTASPWFNNRGTNTNFWSSAQSGSNAWNRNLNSSNSTVNRNANTKAYGFSVRCLKDWFIKLKVQS